VKRKRVRTSTDVVVEIIDHQGKGRALRGLLDSGCTRTIILKEFCGRVEKGPKVTYETYGNEVSTSSYTDLQLKLTEFSHSKTINYNCMVDLINKSKNSSYDIILGTDFLSSMGMVLDFKKNVIIWDEEALAMKQLGMLTDEEAVDAIYFAHSNAPLLQDIEARQQKVLDADYSKVDIDEMVDAMDLNPDTKTELKKTFKKFPVLFGGGLGLLDIEPVKIELQKGAKPYKGKYYSTPKAFVNPLKKVIEDFSYRKS